MGREIHDAEQGRLANQQIRGKKQQQLTERQKEKIVNKLEKQLLKPRRKKGRRM